MVLSWMIDTDSAMWKRNLFPSGMILAISILLIICLEVNNLASNLDNRPNTISVKSFNIAGMPIKIDDASVIRPHAIPELSLIVSNLSSEQVMKLHLIFFIFDSDGKPKAKEEYFEQVDFSLNQSINISYIPTNVLAKGDRVVVTLQRVVGKLGVWSVTLPDLEENVKAYIRDKQHKPLIVAYTENLAVTAADKAEVQILGLQHILQNKEVGDFFSVKNSRNINLLSRNTEPSIAKKISGTRVNILSLGEIKEKANRNGEVFYFEFTYLNFEGTKADVSIAYEHRVRERIPHSPCCGYVTLTLSKDTGNWRIVETIIEGK
jgi:hypothetical protein